MKEYIHTIPVSEAFETHDECPFCALERTTEQNAIRYVLGPAASYMEPDVRGATDRLGFCREHMKKMYDYGNTLGSALILQTYMAVLLEEFHNEAAAYEMPPKKSILPGKKAATPKDAYENRLQQRVDSCFLCEKLEYNMSRYYLTFFAMLKDAEFRKKVENTKGFCLRHFARLLREAREHLPNAQREWFYATLWPLMEENLIRVKDDLDWLVAKYDFRNAGKPWGNSQDALQRAMQKMEGLYPADPPYKND